MKLVLVFCVMVLVGPLISIGAATAQGAGQSDQVIDGNQAWEAAKTYGFRFRPERRPNEISTSPFDGQNTRNFYQHLGTNILVARVEQGKMITEKPLGFGNSTNTNEVIYTMFESKRLSPDWTIQNITLVGDGHVFIKAPQYGTDDANFRVALTSYRDRTALRIGTITLRGPSGANWRDAFNGTRKAFTVPGILAWTTAKQYGFEFYPVITPGSICSTLSAPRDGVKTELNSKLIGGCPVGTLASVVGGNMIVNAPNRTQTFCMFGMFPGCTKKLAPGWRIKEVKVSPAGIRWVRRPVDGSDDMSFELERTSRDSPVSAFVTSVILTGPSNAASWQDAFKNAK